jgi:hypothetical protein
MVNDTKRLFELVRHKHQLLVELRELGKRQAALIAAGDMNELLRMFAGKQRLIDRLHDVERCLDPYRGQDPESRDWQSAAQRQECASVIEQSQSLLKEILQQEKSNEARLRLSRDEVARRLQGLQVVKQARQAYVNSGAPRASRVDLSS